MSTAPGQEFLIKHLSLTHSLMRGLWGDLDSTCPAASGFFFSHLLPHCICLLQRAQEVGATRRCCGWGELWALSGCPGQGIAWNGETRWVWEAERMLPTPLQVEVCTALRMGSSGWVVFGCSTGFA